MYQYELNTERIIKIPIKTLPVLVTVTFGMPDIKLRSFTGITSKTAAMSTYKTLGLKNHKGILR
ncbi:hypothetical protein GCM10007938_21490 [Vibrio zhanjiangensis]|uniref:Uncharacterized protein n=1 Tax=Vibrio zhanjiangensis TaxID=1046128 RepID=A0ABQ6F0B2_9VIBR|nr:hypothetical protein GCM10007938_21490 [Vibrio zhanjiangensis]